MQDTPKETALSIVLASRHSPGTSPTSDHAITQTESKSTKDANTETERKATKDAGTQPESKNTKDAGTQTDITWPLFPVLSEMAAHTPTPTKLPKDPRWIQNDRKVKGERCAPEFAHMVEKHQRSFRRYWNNADQKQFQRKTTTKDTRNVPKNPRHANTKEKEALPEPPRVNFDREEFNREVKENNLKTLKDSRWAQDNPKVEGEQSAPEFARMVEKHHRSFRRHWNNADQKQFQRNTNVPKNPRHANTEEKEAPPEPPRVIFDWEEFNREVKENNWKTLKDSRWAN
ncbi:hypothetical protein F4859DRAFT_515609 [Xylaria cf. heliscus]|nr:hypothetical protein F4859DRAFT_515609 [Xylaria cf. heliscus]